MQELAPQAAHMAQAALTPQLCGAYIRHNQAAVEVGDCSEGKKCKKRKCPKDSQLEGNRERE